MTIPELTDDASATYQARLVTDPRLNALEIALLDLVFIDAFSYIEQVAATLIGPGHDPDVKVAILSNLTDLNDRMTSGLLLVEATLDKVRGELS